MVIPYTILGLTLVVGAYILARWFMVADPRKVLAAIRWSLAIVGLLAVLYLLVTGRYGLILWTLAFFLPMLLRSRGLWQRMKAMRGPSAGQQSQVNTRYLRMVLDHDTGEMDGTVSEGAYQGAQLGELSLEDLLSLLREIGGQDPQSAAVLEAYLDRVHGDSWREAAGEPGAGATGGAGAGRGGSGAGRGMTREEAHNILGVKPGASAKEITEAHRKLMQKVHPDHGGSNYLAAKINEAKDLLLKR